MVEELADKIIKVFETPVSNLEAMSKAAKAVSIKWDVSYNLKIIKESIAE